MYEGPSEKRGNLAQRGVSRVERDAAGVVRGEHHIGVLPGGTRPGNACHRVLLRRHRGDLVFFIVGGCEGKAARGRAGLQLRRPYPQRAVAPRNRSTVRRECPGHL